MQDFANQRAFDAPGTRPRAAGQGSFGGPNSPIYGADGRTIVGYATNGGIQNPVPHPIKPGIIVRFGQNGVAELVLQGEWWLEDEEYRKIEAFARTRQIGLAAAVRLLCAVPTEWSNLDLVVRARVFGPLLSYRGVGNSAVIPVAKGQVGDPGRSVSGLVDQYGKPVGQVIGARPAKLAQAPQYARREYVAILTDANGQRIRQLFIPGLGNGDVRRATLLFQSAHFLSREEAGRGYQPVLV